MVDEPCEVSIDCSINHYAPSQCPRRRSGACYIVTHCDEVSAHPVPGVLLCAIIGHMLRRRSASYPQTKASRRSFCVANISRPWIGDGRRTTGATVNSLNGGRALRTWKDSMTDAEVLVDARSSMTTSSTTRRLYPRSTPLLLSNVVGRVVVVGRW